jgi:hypothetical protein
MVHGCVSCGMCSTRLVYDAFRQPAVRKKDKKGFILVLVSAIMILSKGR